MITKSVKKLLLAALAISLFAGSALAKTVDPSEATASSKVSVDITVGETAQTLKEMTAYIGVLETINKTTGTTGIIGAAKTAAANSTAKANKFVDEFSTKIAPALTTTVFHIGKISTAALEAEGYTFADAVWALKVQFAALAADVADKSLTGMNDLIAAGAASLATPNTAVAIVADVAGAVTSFNTVVADVADKSLTGTALADALGTALTATGTKPLDVTAVLAAIDTSGITDATIKAKVDEIVATAAELNKIFDALATAAKGLADKKVDATLADTTALEAMVTLYSNKYMAVRFVNNAMATSGAYTSAAAAVTNLSSSTTNTAENVDLQALEATEKTFKVTLTEGETNTGVAGQMFTDLKNTAFVATMHNVTYAIKSGTAVSMDLAGITCTLGEGKKEEAEAVEADTLLYVKIGNKKVANLAITEANGADTAENVAATVEVAITFLTAASDEDPTTAKVLADAFIKSYVATVTSATYTDTTKAISAIAALYGSEDAAGDDCLTKAMTAIAAYAYGYDASGTNTNKYDALLYIAMADDPATASGALKVAASAVTSTATVANVYTAIASDPETYAAAVIDYLTSFLSEDAIKNDTGDMMVNWGDIDEDGTLQQVYYPIAHTNGAVFGKLGSSAPTVSSPLVIKAAKGTLPIKMLAATLSGTRDITIDTKILHAEMASFDTTPKYSKYTVAPTDVTNGITVDDELAAKKEVLVRVIFLSSGDVGDDKSVGILTESTTTTDGVLAAKTLAADALKDYGVNKGKLAQLQQGYPYLVQFKVQFDGAASGSETTTAETYKLKASDVVLTGSDGQSKTVAASTKYAVSQDSAAKDALWTAAPVVFSVSSDQLASFEITVSADANVISAKASDGGDATITGKKIDFDGIEGTYTIILSSDLVASSDATKVSTDAGYFAITVDVLSVSVAPVVPVTPGSTEPGSTEPEPTEPTEPEGPVAVDPANAETTTSNGETVAAAGQAINNAFTGSNGASAISGLINSAKTAEMADAADVAGALGLDEAEIGDATKGYKAIGFEIPESQTMPAEGTPFFVITRNGSTNHVGFGYVPKRRAGYERILAVLFSLFRDPSDTEKYMVVDAGDNTVAATDSDGATSGNVSTVNRVVFVTADGDAFSVKTDGTVPLQGQDAKGNATEIVKGDDDDDDDNATSGHGGGSSGCDAGFGLIALAAVALAARKIRK